MRGNKYKYTLIKEYLQNEFGYSIQIYDDLPKKQKLSWLNGDFPLEIDLICRKKKIAIEINGRQHYEPVIWDKRQTNESSIRRFKTQVEMDKIKEQLLYNHGWKLIVFPDDFPLDNKIKVIEHCRRKFESDRDILISFNKEEYEKIFSLSRGNENLYPEEIEEVDLRLSTSDFCKSIINKAINNCSKRINITGRYSEKTNRTKYTNITDICSKMLNEYCHRTKVPLDIDEAIERMIEETDKLPIIEYEYNKKNYSSIFLLDRIEEIVEETRKRFGIRNRRKFIESLITENYRRK